MDALDSPDLDPTPQVEFAFMADSVQAVAGKLYVIGGGWDTLYVRSLPARHPSMGIGVRVRVPWSDLDEFSLSVDLVDEDGANMFDGRTLSQRIRIRRRESVPAGGDLGVVRAFTFNNLVFPKEGGYAFRLLVDDEEVARLRFRIHHRPHPAGRTGDQSESDEDA